jgi:hypothetical protein
MRRIPGRTLLSAFDQEVLRRDAARQFIESQITSVERRIAAANAEREAAYAELADFYSADEGRLASTFGEISQRLQRIFDEKMQRRRQINELLQQSATLIAEQRKQFESAQDNEAECHRRLDAVLREVEQELAGDGAFQQLRHEAEALVETAKSLRQAHADLAKESATKLAPFERDRLFRYLLAAGYGTAAYRAGRWSRAGDDWIARLVRWEENRAAYALLQELPGFAERRALEAEKRAELAKTQAEYHVRKCESERGVDPLRTALTGATQTREAIGREIAKLEDERLRLMDEAGALDKGADPFQARAKAEMKQFLAANPVAALRARASHAGARRDDALFDQIERAETAINDGRRQVKSLVAERSAAEQQQRRALQARRTFADEYAGTYDQFDPGFDVTGFLAGFIAGEQSDRALWAHVDHHYYDATPQYSHDNSSSGSSWSSGDSGISFGGDSGGGFSTGGGDSGGGFSTGGGD